MFEKILVAHDGSDGAERAFQTTLELAASLRLAEVRMISSPCRVLVVSSDESQITSLCSYLQTPGTGFNFHALR